MSQDARISGTSIERLMRVVEYLPPGPFSARDLLDLAVGINAVENCREIEPFLEYLVERGVICRPSESIGLWALTDHRSVRRRVTPGVPSVLPASAFPASTHHD
jgi:hypothetical protein